MPGFRRPYTTAFEPTQLSGFDALEKAFAEYRPINHGSLRRKSSVEARRQSVPTTFVEIATSDEEESSVESEQLEDRNKTAREAYRATPPHEHLQAGLRPARKLVTPPHLIRGSSGLPPTPPTMANSDDNEPRAESLASNVQFADAVRDALHKQKSGLSTPGRHLPTPDPSPPGTTENLNSPALQPMLLHPLTAHHLRQYPSSRAESFHTAREDPSRSQHNLIHTPSPGPRPSTQTWLDSTRAARLTDIDFSQSVDESLSSASRAPEHVPALRHTVPPYLYATPTYSRRAKRAASPYRTPESEIDLEKHVSYISNEDETVPYFLQQDDAKFDALVASSWLSGSPMEDTSAEDVNNLVYKQIQEENVKRHSLISNGSAVAVGIYAESPVREHKLKRTARHESLRNFSNASDSSHRDSMDIVPRPLRLSKAQIPSRSLEASPIVESSPKAQRVLPKSRDTREIEIPMARLTRAAMVGEGELATGLKREHTLRHASKNNRLENSVQSRRTSAESASDGAPLPTSLESSPNLSSTTKTLRRVSRNAHLENGAPVRRASPHVPSYLAEELPPGMELERTLRHFSNETKLENNTHVRRTGLDLHSAFVPASHRKSSLDWHGGFVPSSSRKNSLDLHSGVLPASPRKNSLDVRILHPITTPMSISQFSDQMNVEVCEAKGVNIYPHNNHSLLVVQHGSRPESKDEQLSPPPDNYLGLTNQHLGIGMPLFPAHVQELSPTLGAANPTIQVDSPLTNPRAAPIPPALQVIPPTPCEELERELTADEQNAQRPGAPQRRESLIQRARRFSESFTERPLFGRTASLRKPARRDTEPIDTRPQTLSPFWQPRRFWDGYDNESDDLDDYEDIDGLTGARLPAGGDTSSIESQRRRGILPRSMSVRMPGFRGQGGFLLGNSLGLDRHGTNNRRHHVVRKRRSSSGGLHTGSGASAYVSQAGLLRKRASEEMLRRKVGGSGNERGVFTLPFSGGRRVRDTITLVTSHRTASQFEKDGTVTSRSSATRAPQRHLQRSPLRLDADPAFEEIEALITRICHQLRKEMELLFYRCSHFVVEMATSTSTGNLPNIDVGGVKAWLGRLNDKKASSTTHLELSRLESAAEQTAWAVEKGGWEELVSRQALFRSKEVNSVAVELTVRADDGVREDGDEGQRFWRTEAKRMMQALDLRMAYGTDFAGDEEGRVAAVQRLAEDRMGLRSV